MIRGVVFVLSAGLVALVALVGQWEVEQPAPVAIHTTAPVTATASTNAGTPWLPITLGLILVIAAACAWTAWRRRRALATANAARQIPTPRSDEDEWPGYTVEHWHVIVEAIHGDDVVELRRGPLDWPSTSALAVRREVRRRWIAAYGTPRPGVRIEVSATPRTHADTAA